MRRFATKFWLALFILTTGLIAGNLAFQAEAAPGVEWVALTASNEGDPAVFEPMNGNGDGFTLEWTLPGFFSEETLAGGQTWDRFNFPGQGYLGHVGAPNLPVMRKLFALPANSGVRVSILNLEYEEFENVVVEPKQPSLLETESPADKPFAQDTAIYETDAFVPANWAEAAPIGVVHGIRIGQLELRPFRLNPVTGILQVATRVELKIEFAGTDSSHASATSNFAVAPRLETPLKNLLINYPFIGMHKSELDAGIDYLIVADPSLLGAQSLADLVAYHEGRGRTVEVVDVSTLGTTSDEIKTYIQAEYDSISPPDLDYLLLVGDVSVIPFKHGAHLSKSSDAWYGWLEGGDIFGDIGIGRFPATNETELDNMVQKTLAFHNKSNPGAWLDKTLLVAHAQLYPDKYTACKETIYDHQFQIDPPQMDRMYGGDSVENFTSENLADAIDEGYMLINYRGHGEEQEWWEWNLTGQSFLVSHARALQNGTKTPIIFSIACLNVNMEHELETLGEAFLRYEQGAVAFLGAIHPSYTYPNHDFDRSLYNGVWDQGINVIGDLLNWANLDMYNVYGPGTDSESNIAMYLWLADPTLTFPVAGLAAPDSLVAEALSGTEIKLTWEDRSDDETGFSIERQDAAKGFIEVTTVTTGVTTWTDTGLSECVGYTYRVRAFDGVDYSYYTNEVPTETLAAPPSNLAGNGTAVDAITLTWTDSTACESGFAIYRYDEGTGEFEFIAQAAAESEIYVDEVLDEGTVYQYKIATRTLGGDSTQIGPVSTITLPVAPSDLAGTPAVEGPVTLTWTDLSGGEQGYTAMRRVQGETIWNEAGATGANGETFTDDAVAEATAYEYSVCGFNGSGNGPLSAPIVLLTVPAAAGDTLADPISSSQIALAWFDESLGESGFRIERDLGNGFAELTTVNADGNEYQDTDLTEGVLATYRVMAFNATGDALPGPETTTMTMPETPSNLTASFTTKAEDVVLVNWADNSETEDGYRLERRTIGGAWDTLATLSPDALEFEDSQVPNGRVVYRVCAFNAYTDSEFSNMAGVATEDADPNDDDDTNNDSDTGDSGDDDDDDDGGCGC
jgi:Peptidase family C25/Propeptide_C25